MSKLPKNNHGSDPLFEPLFPVKTTVVDTHRVNQTSLYREVMSLKKVLEEKEAHIVSLESALKSAERIKPDIQDNIQDNIQDSLVPPNPYLKQDIPYFIRVYSGAPGHFDHLIDWSMFSLPQLEYFLGMFNRLCRDDLAQIVSRYEARRNTLQSLISKAASRDLLHDDS